MMQELIGMLEEISKKKRIWVRGWIGDSDRTGGSALLLTQLRIEDPGEIKTGFDNDAKRLMICL